MEGERREGQVEVVRVRKGEGKGRIEEIWWSREVKISAGHRQVDMGMGMGMGIETIGEGFQKEKMNPLLRPPQLSIVLQRM